MHAIDAQKRMHDIMWRINDTNPLPEKVGRILVAINVLADVIATGDDESNGFQQDVEETRKWLVRAIELLPGQVAHFGNCTEWELTDANPDAITEVR